MKRSGPPQRRKPKASALWRQVRQEVQERAHGLCEAGERSVCQVRGQHAHHVVLRARGGADTAENLMWVCFACHEFIHRNPEQATERGWMRSEKVVDS